MERYNKMEKHTTVGTFLKSNRKMVKKANFDIPNTQIYDTHFPGFVHVLQYD